MAHCVSTQTPYFKPKLLRESVGTDRPTLKMAGYKVNQMTPAELKYNVERTKSSSFFFTRSTMAFFGDTMKNYGVRSATITLNDGTSCDAWELYRKRPVKHGLKDSAYFAKSSFERVFPARECA